MWTHTNTFACSAFERPRILSGSTRKCGAISADVALVKMNWIGRIHYNAKFDVAKHVAVTMVYLSSGGTIDSAASLLGMSKTSAVG
jgi:hypothetical protein